MAGGPVCHPPAAGDRGVPEGQDACTGVPGRRYPGRVPPAPRTDVLGTEGTEVPVSASASTSTSLVILVSVSDSASRPSRHIRSPK